MKNEKIKLERVAKWYSTFKGFEKILLQHRAEYILNFCQGKNALEVGCADGLTTTKIVEKFGRVVVVEASKRNIEATKKLVDGKAEFHLSLFEEFNTTEKFDNIFLLNILEHIKDPQNILEKAKSMLSQEGKLLISVPNAGSIHRRVGVFLRFLDSYDSLSDIDIKSGHRRVYTLKKMRNEIEKTDLKIEFIKGISIKPLSNQQMEKLPLDVAKSFLKLDTQLPPEFCCNLFAMCKKDRTKVI